MKLGRIAEKSMFGSKAAINEVLKFFNDPTKPIVLATGASSYGLRAILYVKIGERKPVMFALLEEIMPEQKKNS